jgi:hypothetical protein
MNDDRLTFADLRAMITERGLDSRVEIIGGWGRFEEIELTRGELTAWLDRVSSTTGSVRITVQSKRDLGRARLLLDRLLDPGSLRTSAVGYRRG